MRRLSEIESPKLERKIPISLTYEQVQNLFSQPDTSDFLDQAARFMRTIRNANN